MCDVQLGQYEVDFMVDPMGTPSYYHVSMSNTNPATRQGGLRPLKTIGDNYPKNVITYTDSL